MRKSRDYSIHHSKIAHVASASARIRGKVFPFGSVVSYDYNVTGHLVSIRAAHFPRYKGDKAISCEVWEYDAIWGEWSVNLEEFNGDLQDRLWSYWQKLRCNPPKGAEYRLDTGNTRAFMQEAITRKKSSGGVVDAKHIHDITDYSGSKTIPFKDFMGADPAYNYRKQEA